ncbi:hypothetical protein CC86DRAFT_54732 [Ophiobolus disseminans]|uniref:Uncharacterized protein n=1 Tax=Ophiobolus disseminans TaxID=1469910 RepID=A0A6A6ZTI5_9PLEO|nr:hypothetical protein CC86DRAFT_54732 [Ophiobolus disseminans]
MNPNGSVRCHNVAFAVIRPSCSHHKINNDITSSIHVRSIKHRQIRSFNSDNKTLANPMQS